MSYFKTNELNGKRIAYSKDTIFEVQIGKNKSAYKTKWSFAGNLAQAVMYFNGLNVHSGYKKRLVCWSINNPILARVITY